MLIIDTDTIPTVRHCKSWQRFFFMGSFISPATLLVNKTCLIYPVFRDSYSKLCTTRLRSGFSANGH